VDPCLSVVIPAYNESATIEEVIRRVLAQPATREVVVVDDASTDGTRDRLARQADPRVRVLYQPFNLGKGAALRRGFEAVTSDFVIVQDADLEYDPQDYPALLGPLLDGRADVVFGSRFISGGAHRVLYYWHSVGNRLLTTASNVATNLNLSDMETCYKAFRREVIQSIDLREDRFGFEPEITAKVAAGGWRIYEVGVTYHGRTYAEGKKIGWRDGVRALYCVARYSVIGRTVAGWVGRPSGLPAGSAAGGGASVVQSGAVTPLASVAPVVALRSGPPLAVVAPRPDPTAGLSPNAIGWLAELVEPWLGQDVVVLGAAARALAGELASSEDRPGLCAVDRVDELVGRRRPDTFVLVQFLEAQVDPAETLRWLRDRLAPEGRIVLLVPALGALRHVAGRSRRAGPPAGAAVGSGDPPLVTKEAFDRSMLRRALARAELQPELLRPVNASASVPGGRLLAGGRLGPRGRTLLGRYDRALVPLLRAVDQRVELPIGQSLFCVARPAPVPVDVSGVHEDEEGVVVLP
jgi:hypothetical protein